MKLLPTQFVIILSMTIIQFYSPVIPHHCSKAFYLMLNAQSSNKTDPNLKDERIYHHGGAIVTSPRDCDVSRVNKENVMFLTNCSCFMYHQLKRC